MENVRIFDFSVLLSESECCSVRSEHKIRISDAEVMHERLNEKYVWMDCEVKQKDTVSILVNIPGYCSHRIQHIDRTLV
jgi:hypothetical protein